MLQQTNFEQERLLNEPSNNERITNVRLRKELEFLQKSSLKYTVQRLQPSNNANSRSNATTHNNSNTEQEIINLIKNKDQRPQISYRITIEPNQQSKLSHPLILLIPKHYPFQQPIYYHAEHHNSSNQINSVSTSQSRYQQTQPLLSGQQSTHRTRQNSEPKLTGEQLLTFQLHKSHPISELLTWMPKYKILELVELIAIKLSQKKHQQNIINQYSLGHVINHLNNWKILFLIAILIRVLVALGSYSGKGDFPNLGDFQAHRNWMSITVNRPISEWYQELSNLQDIWWRIDYPPIAAYLSYVLGSIYKHIQPQAMAYQRGYESQSLATFMRFSVLLVQILFVFPALYLLSQQAINPQYTLSKKYINMILFSLILKPDLILIDHGHFQYNSLIIGLILMSFYCLLNRNYYICCILFTIAIHSKQMAVYYALAFFAGLIGKVYSQHRMNRAKVIGEIIKFGTIVLTVSLIIWLPFIVTSSAHLVLEAIFPVHRGLYQLKVQNFWCITDVIMKWQSKFSKPLLMFFCFVISTVLSLPSMFAMITTSTKKVLTLGFYTIGMTFFMFSYHVHEKSILLPLAMAPFIIPYLGPNFVVNFILSGTLGMYHLLKEDGQWLQYFVIIVFYIIYMDSFAKITCQLSQFTLEPERSKTTVERLHQKLFTNDIKDLRFSLAKYSCYLVILGLHLAQIFVPPAQKLQYLYHLLFAFYSFCFNAYSLVICNGILLESAYEKFTGKKREEKTN